MAGIGQEWERMAIIMSCGAEMYHQTANEIVGAVPHLPVQFFL